MNKQRMLCFVAWIDRQVYYLQQANASNHSRRMEEDDELFTRLIRVENLLAHVIIDVQLYST